MHKLLHLVGKPRGKREIGRTRRSATLRCRTKLGRGSFDEVVHALLGPGHQPHLLSAVKVELLAGLHGLFLIGLGEVSQMGDALPTLC